MLHRMKLNGDKNKKQTVLTVQERIYYDELHNIKVTERRAVGVIFLIQARRVGFGLVLFRILTFNPTLEFTM